MKRVTEDSDENFWVLMSIMEIRAQAKFAHMAYDNIAEKPGRGDEWAVFSSIHSFLSHCALISKMLKSTGAQIVIGDVLSIPDNSIIHQRRFRNHLEHYDERLKSWIEKAGFGTSVVNHHIGNRKNFPIQEAVFVNFYDPFTKIFTFVDEDFDLGKLYSESVSIKKAAIEWLELDDD